MNSVREHINCILKLGNQIKVNSDAHGGTLYNVHHHDHNR